MRDLLGAGLLTGAKSVLRRGLGEDSLNRFLRLANAVARRTIRFEFQISLQVVQLRAIVTFAAVKIGSHEIGIRGVGIAEQSLMDTSFRFILAIQLH
jgi:hypothetical protein